MCVQCTYCSFSKKIRFDLIRNSQNKKHSITDPNCFAIKQLVHHLLPLLCISFLLKKKGIDCTLFIGHLTTSYNLLISCIFKRFSLSLIFQIEELYEEVLYEIIHNVGCEVENETCPEALFQYLQDAFKVNKLFGSNLSAYEKQNEKWPIFRLLMIDTMKLCDQPKVKRHPKSVSMLK